MTEHRFQDASEGLALSERAILALLFSASLLFLAVSAGAQEPGPTPMGSATAPDDPHLEIEDGRITVRATDAPLMPLLEEIARSTRLTVEVDGAFEQRISVEFEDLPLIEAVDRLLSGHNYILQRGTDSDRLLVFPNTAAENRSSTIKEDPGPEPTSDGRETEEQRLERLILALADDHSEVRVEAVSELTGLDPRHTVEILASVAVLDPEPAVREESAYALAEIGDEAAVVALQQVLLDPAARVREAALEAFVDIGGDASAFAIEFVLYDQDADLRQAAAYALGDIGGDEAREILLRALSDEDSFVVEAAMEALEDLEERQP